jgi:acetyltransferase
VGAINREAVSALTYVPPDARELAGPWTASDGTTLWIRPIRPEDAPLEAEFVRRLSPRSRRLRFMNALRELAPQQVERFTHVDPARELALVALGRDGQGREEQVAVARYVVDSTGRSAEFAIAVADAWQRRGLGRHLLGRLLAAARRGGLESIHGRVLAENAGMLALARGLGFAIAPLPGEPGVRRVTAMLDVGAR